MRTIFVRILDEALESDDEFVDQVERDLTIYFEALSVEVEMVDSSDFWSFEGDLALADA